MLEQLICLESRWEGIADQAGEDTICGTGRKRTGPEKCSLYALAIRSAIVTL